MENIAADIATRFDPEKIAGALLKRYGLIDFPGVPLKI